MARLSWRRPLPWRGWLPLATGGVVFGVLCGFHWGPEILWAWGALLALAPVLLLAHRRCGMSVLLFAVSATIAAARTPGLEPSVRSSAGRSALEAREIRARVQGVKTGSWGSGSPWAALELEIVDTDAAADGGPGVGDGVRLSIGRSKENWEVGDELAFAAAPRRVRGFCNLGVDRWAETLARRGIHWTARVRDDAAVERLEAGLKVSLGGALDRMRGRVGSAIDHSAEGESAAILRALVIGDRGRVTPELRTVFARTGTAHLLAVSGMHLALVGALVYALVGYFWSLVGSRWCGVSLVSVAGPCSVLGAAGYAALTGGAVSTTRALVMAVFAIVGLTLRRNSSSAGALLGAILVLLVADPGMLAAVSFQLSVISVAAILFAQHRMRATRLGGWTAEGASGGGWRRGWAWASGACLVSVAAGCATMPLGAHYFGLISLVGVPANLVLGPLLGVGALVLGLLGALLGQLTPMLGAPLLLVAGAAIELALNVARGIAAWPAAALDVDLPQGTLVAALLMAMGGACARNRWCRGTAWVGSGLLGLVGLLGWAGPAELRLVVLDVGQGDALVLQTAARRTWVVDAGGLAGSFDTGERVVVPLLSSVGIGSGVGMVLSHADRDHYGGLAAVASSRPVSAFWWNGRGSSARGFRRLLDVLEHRGIERRRAVRGRALGRHDRETEITVLSPSGTGPVRSSNDASVVLSVRYGATHLLLAGDVEAPSEQMLLAGEAWLGASVLKVPHHGSRSSSTAPLLDAVRPALALASLGYRNRFGFPAKEVRRRYRERGARWVATDRAGEITLRSDGQLEVVDTCRPVGVA